MSDTYESTVRTLFTGDAASLIQAFNSAADAAQAAVDKISRAADEATGSLDGTGTSVQGLGEKFAQAGEAATGLGERLDTIGEGAGASVEGLQAKFEGLDSSIAGVDEKLGTVADTSEEVAGKVDESSSFMSAALARVGVVLEGLEGKFGIVGEAAGKMGATISAAAEESDAKLGESGAAADGLAGSLASVGKGTVIGLAVAAAGALDLADKMDQATGSIAATAGISTDAASKIGAAFDSTAGQFIMSGTAMAKAYAPVAAQLGAVQGHALSAAQALLVEKDAALAAEATGGSLTSTTSALAAAMQAYQIPISQATAATNALYVAGKDTGSGFSAIGGQLSKLRATLGGLAPSLSDSSALLVDLTEHGETGRKAMSALSTAVTGLEKPTIALATAQSDQKDALAALPPSVHALAEEYLNGSITSKNYTTATQGLSTTNAVLASQFASATTAVTKAKLAISTSGIAVENAKGQFIGMGPVIDELHKQIQGMSTQQALATLTQDGLGSSAAKLLPTIEAGSAAFRAASDAVSKQNAAQEAAAKATANLHDQFEKVKSAIEDVFTEVGERLMPVIQGFVSVVVGASSFLNQHRAILIGLGVAIGTVLVPAIAAMAAGWAVEAAAMVVANAPLIAVAAAIGGLAAGAYELYKHWNVVWPEIKKITLAAWHDVERAFDDVWHFIERWAPTVLKAILVPFTGGMSEILPIIVSHWHDISSFFSRIPGDVEHFFSNAISWLVNAGHDVINGLWHGIDDIWHDVVRVWFHQVPHDILAWLGDAGKWLIGLGSDIIRGIVTGIKNAVGLVTNAIHAVASTVKGVFSDAFGWLSPTKMTIQLGEDMMLGLAQGVLANQNVAHDAIRKVAAGMNPTFQAGLGSFNMPTGAAGGLAGGANRGASGPVVFNLNMDGQRFAQVVVPDILTAMQQRGRTQNLGI